jgi:SAM-dependent methyltransferase
MSRTIPALEPHTWDHIASRFEDWGPPLRPPAEAVRSYRRLLASWAAGRSGPASMLLFGVTPELVQAEWPVRTHLTAVDRSEPMLRLVWPGDIEGVRRGVVGDWMTYTPAQPPQVVLADGAPVFFARPEQLFRRARQLLSPDGIFLVRTFCAPPKSERPGDVLADARAGRVENFHVLKWRTAMALQADAHSGVRQHDVWLALTNAVVDFAALPQPGFSEAAVSTLDVYKGQTATLHFPTVDAYRAALSSVFARVEIELPGGLFGTQCPVFMACGQAGAVSYAS